MRKKWKDGDGSESWRDRLCRSTPGELKRSHGFKLRCRRGKYASSPTSKQPSAVRNQTDVVLVAAHCTTSGCLSCYRKQSVVTNGVTTLSFDTRNKDHLWLICSCNISVLVLKWVFCSALAICCSYLLSLICFILKMCYAADLKLHVLLHHMVWYGTAWQHIILYHRNVPTKTTQLSFIYRTL